MRFMTRDGALRTFWLLILLGGWVPYISLNGSIPLLLMKHIDSLLIGSSFLKICSMTGLMHQQAQVVTSGDLEEDPKDQTPPPVAHPNPHLARRAYWRLNNHGKLQRGWVYPLLTRRQLLRGSENQRGSSSWRDWIHDRSVLYFSWCFLSIALDELLVLEH